MIRAAARSSSRGAMGEPIRPNTLGSNSEGSESADYGEWFQGIGATPVTVYGVRGLYELAGDQVLMRLGDDVVDGGGFC